MQTAPTAPFRITCERCGRDVPTRPYAARCPACDGTLGFQYAAATAGASTGATAIRDRLRQPARRLWDYAPLLPVERPANAVTLDEGGTPLVPARGDWGCRLWLKDESRNPTGSHKDRALSVAITRGRELGFDSCLILSAGSTGLSTAAYAARAGMRCALVAPHGTPDERLIPAALYGATIFEAPGTFDAALRELERLASSVAPASHGAAASHPPNPQDAAVRRRRADHPLYFTSTYRRGNPYQAEGARTIGFEIASQLAAAGHTADWIVVPTGGGGTVAGIWRAYQELRALHALTSDAPLPAMATVQPAPYNALQTALAHDLATLAELEALGLSEEVPTVQAKLQHGVPPDAEYALAALRESRGAATSVSDDDALAAQRRLASQEGLFAEPSAAAALAGVQRLVAEGTIQPHHIVVALITGSGFRELGAIAPRTRVERTPFTPQAVLDALSLA